MNPTEHQKNLNRKYSYWHWRTLIILIIGYALFYFVRKNFSIAMPALEEQLGITKTKLGLFLTINGVIYGISRFANGVLCDRIRNKKLMMALGLLLSAVVNIIIAFIPSVNVFFNVLDGEGKATMGFIYLLGSLWLINGWLQGMGYPPCSSLMAYWVKPSELATKQSIWNASHSIGAGLLALMIGAILGHYGNAAWQWCFWLPAILAIFGAALIFFGLKNSPEQVGLPPVEQLEAPSEEKAPVEEESPELSARIYKRCLRDLVFRNPIIWILSIADFFVYIIRFTILDWGSSILVQFKGMDISLAASVVGAMEIFGGILGMLTAGWITDKFFKGCAHRTSAVCILMASLCLLAFWLSPKDSVFLTIVTIVLSAFFIYGPQALLCIACPNHATRRAAASANGICGLFSYLSPIVSGLVFGAITEKTGSWDMVFLLSVIFGLVGTVILAFIWKKPANGYDKLERIVAECKAECDENQVICKK